MEKRRVRREIKDTRRKRRGIKKVDSKLASNPVPMCSPQPGTPREVHGVTREEKREEGDKGDQEEKGGGIKGRETDLASNQFLKCSPQPGTPKEIHRVK